MRRRASVAARDYAARGLVVRSNRQCRATFDQIEWDDATAEDCRQLVRLAIREDLEREQDWTDARPRAAGPA